MGLIFEVDLNSNFLFNKYSNYLTKNDFLKLAELNNINIDSVEFTDTLTPIWKLFEVQLKNLSNPIFKNTTNLEPNFKNYVDCFEYILNLSENEVASNIDINKYLDFFKYLIDIHFEFKQYEKYKLMWNVELHYIKKVGNLLIDNGVKFSKLNEITKHREISYLYTIFKGDEYEFFEEYYCYFTDENRQLSTFLNSKYNLQREDISSLLFKNKEYYTTLHTIIELTHRHKQSKYNEFLLISLIRGVILNVEELIKRDIAIYNQEINDRNRYITDNIKTHINKCKDKKEFIKKLKKNTFELYTYISFLSENKYLKKIKNTFDRYKDDKFFEMLELIRKELCFKEKYFYIFHKTRNYVAHNHIDFYKFFDKNAINLVDVIESIIFILIYLEWLKKK